MGVGENLRRIRNARKLSQEMLARKSTVSQSAISAIEREEKAPTASTLTLLAKALGCVPSDLLEEKEKALQVSGLLPVTTHRVPLLGTVHCGEPSFAEQEFESYVEAGAEIHADFALRAKGDSMTGARIQDDDIVFIRRQDTVNNGEIAAVLIDDEAALKRIRYLPGGMTMLQAENPAYEPIFIGGEGETRVVRILGKAIAFQGDVK